MQKLVIKVALFRFGVNKFTKETNSYLANGWSLVSWNIEKKGFKIICSALLHKDE